jgi:hypothetical protein
MWYNPLIILLMRSPLHRIASGAIVVLTYKGRKTGKRYRTPLSYVRDDDCILILTFRRRTWWRGIDPEVPVSVRLEGSEYPALVEILEDPSDLLPAMATYMQKMDYVAQRLNIEIDEDGNPDPEDLARASEGRLIVRAKIMPHWRNGKQIVPPTL